MTDRAPCGHAAPDRDRWTVVLLVLAAALVRAWDIDHMSIWQDEGLSLYRASLDLRGILAGIIPLDDLVTRDVQPPLYFLLLAGWFRLVEPTTWAGKWLSLLAGLPVVPLVWALGRRFAGRPVARAAGVLTALSPVMLWYSQELRSYTLQVTLATLAVYALARALASRRPAWAALAALANVLLVWTHYLGFCLVVFEALAVAAAAGRRGGRRVTGRRRVWRAALPAVAMALAALPLVPYALWRLGVGPERDQKFVALPIILKDIVLGFGLGLSVDHDQIGVMELDLVFAILLGAGMWWAWRARRGSAIFLAGYLFVPVLAVFALTLVKPVYMNVRHILVVAPAFYVLAAAGLVAIWERERFAGLAAAMVACGAMLMSDFAFYGDVRFRKDDLRALAGYVEARAVPGDVLLAPHPVLTLAFRRLLREVPVRTLPPFDAAGLPDRRPAAELLAPLLREHRRLWVMDPFDDAEGWLGAHALHVDAQGFEGSSIPVSVDAYERPPSLRNREAPPRRDTLELGGLELLGWDVAPDPPVAGRGARVRMIWLAARRGLPDYKVALRLVGPSGRDFAAGDHEPYHGQRPTSAWPFGEIVYEPHDLLVSAAAPPGTYALAITVYDPATGEVFPPGGGAPMGEVEVRPAQVPVDLRTLPIPHRLRAVGAGVTVLGFDLPGARAEVRRAGDRVPLAVWLRVEDPDRLPAALRAELVDAWGRVAASAQADLGGPGDPVEGWRRGDVREVPLRLDLPPGAGAYALRLRLLDARGGAAWLRRGAPALLPVRAVWLDRVTVSAPERVTAAPPMAHRLDLLVGDGAQLLGYDLAMDAVRPSGTLSTTLHWRSIARMATSYHVTVQLVPAGPDGVEPAGAPVAQHDGTPAAGVRPTSGWQPGEVVSDPHTLDLPADLTAGDYLLIAALYDPDDPTRPRPAVAQGGRTRDFVLLERIRVAPPGGSGGP